jgi:AbrB family looped-hinge helix DNA binding protein
MAEGATAKRERLREKARVTSKGQITLPKAVRERLRLRPGDDIEFVEDERGLHVQPNTEDFESALEEWRGYLLKFPELRGKTTDELIEEWRGR